MPGPWIDVHGASLDDPMPPGWQHRHELRATDTAPTDKHHWPYRIAQTIAGQSAQQADHDFAFMEALNPSTVLRLIAMARKG